MPNKWDIHQQAKHENAHHEKELVIKNRTVTVHKVVNILGMSQKGVSSEHYEGKSEHARDFQEKGFPIMTMHPLNLLCLHVNFWLKTKCRSTPSLLTTSITVRLFPFPQLMMAFKSRIFNAIIMIQAKPQTILDKFKTLRLHSNVV
jgi:hypothetical protein